MYKGVQVFLFDPKSLNNCVNLLFGAGSASWCWITIIIYCYELVTTKNIIHSFTICILCRIQQCDAAQASRGRLRIQIGIWNDSQMRGREDNQNIFWCELPTGIWHWHQDDKMKTGIWCGETGVMGSLTILRVLTLNAFTFCAICNSILWNHFVMSMMLETGAKSVNLGKLCRTSLFKICWDKLYFWLESSVSQHWPIRRKFLWQLKTEIRLRLETLEKCFLFARLKCQAWIEWTFFRDTLIL